MNFGGGAVQVARRLLGAVLVHDSPEGLTAGRIVETEAYLSEGDGASHSRMGPTRRNGSMFLAAGHAYVYRIYGIHLCFNVVTGPEGRGEAALVRALEPLEGLDLMAQRRGRDAPRDLCSGPGKLVQAMGITLDHDGILLGEGLSILPRTKAVRPEVGRRIGISADKDLPLAFRIPGCFWGS